VDRLYTAPDGWLIKVEARSWDVAAGTFEDWANDTHKQAQIVWREWLGPQSLTDTDAKVVIDQAYYDKALAVVDRQLGLGGLRLARLLNEALSSDRCPAP
jgi:nuclease S1